VGDVEVFFFLKGQSGSAGSLTFSLAVETRQKRF
jgi:hypothetical protein